MENNIVLPGGKREHTCAKESADGKNRIAAPESIIDRGSRRVPSRVPLTWVNHGSPVSDGGALTVKHYVVAFDTLLADSVADSTQYTNREMAPVARAAR